MNETHANYEQFIDIVQKRQLLSQTERALLLDERTQQLFTIRVNHPVGYVDGGSSVTPSLIINARDQYTAEEVIALASMANKLITQEVLTPITPEERREVLLGANQIINPALFSRGKIDFKTADLKNSIDTIVHAYENGSAPVRAWEAQKRENAGYWHVIQLNDNLMMSFAGTAAGLLGWSLAAATGVPYAEQAAITAGAGGIAGLAITGFAQYPLIFLQNFIGRSPIDDEGLITTKHYRFSRHPLYGSRIIGTAVSGISALNPLGLWSAAKGIYHGARACEEQDERMRILYGEQAVEYQKRVPAVIPGTNMLLRGLSKILPENTMQILRTPTIEYAKKLPRIVSEPGKELQGYVGGPNVFLSHDKQAYTPSSAVRKPQEVAA